MSYSYSESSDEAIVRTLIYDTTDTVVPVKGTDYYFDDAEITAIISQNSNDLWATAADLCRSLSAKFAKEAIDLGLGKGDLKIDLTKKSKFYYDLAVGYDRKSTGGSLEEFMDSMNIQVTEYGEDQSEYVGD
ncbi:MAG: hypothetical protein ABH967_00880 [Patescibacteria group bacterium]